MLEKVKKAPYVHQEYPKMLFLRGKINPAHEEQTKGTTRIGNNPEEEELALEDGYKRAPSRGPGVPAEVAAAAKLLVDTERKLAEAKAELETTQEELADAEAELKAEQETAKAAAEQAEKETREAASEAVKEAKSEAKAKK